MARVELAPEVLDDFERFLDHMAQFQIEDAPARIATIVQALDILVRNPMIGRKLRGGNRELVMGQGGRGYVALYRYVPVIDTVVVLAIRSQSEAGFHGRRG